MKINFKKSCENLTTWFSSSIKIHLLIDRYSTSKFEAYLLPFFSGTFNHISVSGRGLLRLDLRKPIAERKR